MLLALLLAAASPAAQPEGVTLVSGVVAGAREAETGLWFDPWETGIGFDMPGATADDAATAFALLNESAESSRSIAVRFDPRSGVFDAERKRFIYRVCALRLERQEAFAQEPSCAKSSRADALAEGIALAAVGRSEAALAELDRGLADTRPAAERVAGLRWRESALGTEATRAGPGGAADAFYVRALADAREWSRLAPDDSEAALAVAADLTALGAYEQAIGAYRAVVTRWPNEDYRASVRVGAIHRQLGDYRQALAALDGLVARAGPQEGMKFHYHRGWTLTLLSRHEEAIAELTTGIQQQPDYGWAYLRRACASARLGRTSAALIDQRRGVALMEQAPPAPPPFDADLKRARAVVGEMEAAERTRSGQPTEAPCTGYDDREAKRARSPLLKG